MNLASLGAIAGGINQGLEYSQRDKERKENQEFLKSQRQFLGEQQGRQRQEWEKTDQYGKDLAGVYAPVEEYTNPPMTEENYASGPQQPIATTSRPTSALEAQQRLMAAQTKAGKYDDALKTRSNIEKIFTDADRQNYNAFLQSAGSISDIGQLGKRAAQLVSADNSPILVDEPKPNDDGKTWTANVRSRINGATIPLTFSSKEDLLKGLQYHMDYETYAANRKAELEAAKKIAEKRAEGVKLRPGETFSQYDESGRLIPTAENNNITPAESSLLRLATAGAGGASGSKSVGKATEDPGMKVLKDIFGMKGPGGVDHTGDQAAAAYNYYNNIPDALPGGAKLAPEMKARIAYDAAINPNTVQTDIDPSTFEITRFYKSAPIKGANGSYVSPAPIPLSKWNIGQAFAAASQDDESGKQARAVLGASTRKLIDSLPESERIGVIDSAHSDQARANFTGQYWSSLRRQVADRTDIPEAAKEQWIDQNMAILNRKIDLAKNFYDAPEWTKDRGSNPSSKFSPEQVNAAKKYGYGSETSIGDVISRAGRGLSSAWSKLMTPSQEAIDNVLRTMRSTGRLDSGNANFLVGAFKRNPDLMKSFTPEQLDAIRVISGQNF